MKINKETTKKIVKIVGNILMVLSIVFVVVALVKSGVSVSVILFTPGLFPCFLVGVAWSVVWLYLMAFAWKRIIEYFSNSKSSFFEMGRVYARANLGKYLPGNVMHFVERNLFAAKLGLNNDEVAMSTALEVVGILISTTFLAVFLSYNDLINAVKRVASTAHLVLFSCAGVVCILVIVIILIKVPEIRRKIKRIASVRFGFVYGLNLILYGISFVVLGLFLVSFVVIINRQWLPLSDVRAILASYVIAYVIGFVVPGAPGGMGVREFVLSFLTAGTPYADTILIASVIHRAMTIVGDVVAYGLSARKKEEEQVKS